MTVACLPRKRKRPAYTFGTCSECDRRFRRHADSQVICGRASCRKSYQRSCWHERYKVSLKRAPLDLPVVHTCGHALDLGTDGNGRTIEWCVVCGVEQPVPVRRASRAA